MINLNETLRLHGLWLRGEEGGVRAVLTRAVLTCAVLTCAVLTGATRGLDALRVDNLHTKMLAAIEAGGLEMATWHTCETTHCRAGWAVVLAGDAGRVAEALLGTAAAGAIIVAKSCPYLDKVPDFYCSNAEALADIRRCAAIEAGAA